MMNKAKGGFTLIELLTVVVIIGILAGIIIGVAGNVQKKAATSRAKAEISAIELALERFKIDNGAFPDWSGIGDDGTVYAGDPTAYDGGLSGGAAPNSSLFEQLVGRPSFEDQDAASITGTQYFEVKSSQVGDPSGNSYLMDPYGYPYGYYYDATGDPKSLFNQVYPDLWSTSGETRDPSNLEDPIYLRWVTNWGSR